MTSQNPENTNASEPNLKPTRDNVILIIAIVVAALNLGTSIGAIFAFNWFSLVLGLVNTLVWFAVILVQLRRTNRRK